MPARILVVEDDLIQQQVLERFLVSHGYHVATAGTGLEAVKKIRDNRYDVIILDYAMPGFDGVDAARWIRREVAGSIQPCLIALSANTRGMLENESNAEKMFDHIEQKPWNPRGLISILNALETVSGVNRFSHVRSGSSEIGHPAPDGSPTSQLLSDDDIPLLQVTSQANKVKVLILDQDDMVLSAFRRSLEDANYEVTSLTNKVEAVEIMKREKFDIVFSDYFGPAKFCGSPSVFLAQLKDA